MTAVSACRIELEALRERLSTLIHELLVAERITDAFDVTVVSQIDGREVARNQVRVAASATAAPTKTVTPTDAPKTAILSALRKAGEPLSGPELVAATRQSACQLKPHLDALVRQGGIVKSGQTSSTRYALAPTLRSGPAAGTPRGPAGGTGPDHRPAEFETVWNGTKERNGEAPSILPPRERKA